jgi:predicted nuclease of predicted toxin-antitoxin system
MRVGFLADECFPVFLIHALREAGFNVVRPADTGQGKSDIDVLGLAASEQRIVLTEDNDFGELAVRLGLPTLGVIRIDLKPLNRESQVARVLETLRSLGDEVRDAIISIEPSRTRIRKIVRPESTA